ncbi:MAG: hypothetical protein HZC42_02455 [Candidatus Eisenbacteria bacterium]|nr:hypothetical protein [Candidatus Eisenbacteria bacterium]
MGFVRRALLASALLASVLCPAIASASTRVVVADNGTGTTSFPPYALPGYQSPPSVLAVEAGLPPGSQLLGTFKMQGITVISEVPGGGLGGAVQTFKATLLLDLQGTGAYAGYYRSLTLSVDLGVSHTAPRLAGSSPQSFDTDMFQFFAQLPPGDPDFDLLRITGGTDFGMPSPGHTTLTRLPDGNWAVDSFFDIEYRIDFIGAPGSVFAGRSGSTMSGSRFQEGQPPRSACGVPSIGGTADFPPPCVSGYLSPPDASLLLNGLPSGEPVTGSIRIRNIVTTSEVPGGTLGGALQDFTASAVVDLVGNGPLIGFRRSIAFPVTGRTETAPRSLGASVQGFPANLLQLQGQLIGDPDFDLLRIVAGGDFGMPSPGHTTLTLRSDGRWTVDSFFDIEYLIDFVGAAGGSFGGMSGSTTSSSRFDEGQGSGTACLVPEVSGTAQFPATCAGGYLSLPGALVLETGLPPGTLLLGTIRWHNVAIISEVPGGSLGGAAQTFSATAELNVTGTGLLSGYSRVLTFPLDGGSETAMRFPGTTPQSFPADLTYLHGQLPPGDPDFDLLRITAGTGFGMPSPGHTVLTYVPVSNWAVDSFFDIEYRVDFIGTPGSPFAGMSGSTTSQNRFQAGQPPPVAVPGGVPTALRVSPAFPNPASAGSRVELELPRTARVEAGIYDVAGRLVRTLERGELPAGRRALRWDGLDAAGARVGAGLYFYRVRVDGAAEVRRVAFTR